MNGQKTGRYRMLVDTKVQSRIIMRAIILFLFIILIFTVLPFTRVREGEETVFSSGIRALHAGKTVSFPFLARIFLMILILGGAGALWNLLRYTHKVLGPLVRFKKVLKDLGRGRFPERIKFREDDELKELAEVLGESVLFLNQKIRTIQQDFDFVYSTLMYRNVRNLNHTDLVLLNNKIHKVRSLLKEFHTR